jgi:hypothetical protein
MSFGTAFVALTDIQGAKLRFFGEYTEGSLRLLKKGAFFEIFVHFLG